MSADEFYVLFQIIQNFNITNLRKDSDISKLDTSKLNGTRKKKIKELFIRYLRNLQEQGKIHEQIFFPLQSESF